MSAIRDILRFRTMLAPYLLEVLFWAGIGGTLYGTYWLYSHNQWAWWIALILGPIATRVIFETGLLAFRSYERLVEIRASLAQMQ